MRRFVMYCAVVAVLISGSTAAMSASWFDNLNSYVTENSYGFVDIGGPGSLWTCASVASLPYVVLAAGLDGSQCAGNSDPNPSGIAQPAFRPIDKDVSGVVYCQMRVGGVAESETRLGVFGLQNAFENFLRLPEDFTNQAYIDFYNNGIDPIVPRIQVNQGGTVVANVALGTAALTVDAWYDVKVAWSASHKKIVVSYKLNSDTTWTDSPEIVSPQPINFNYLAFGMFMTPQGSHDNLGFDAGPPPGTASGSVALQDYTGDVSLVPVRIEFKKAGETLGAQDLKLTSNPMSFSQVGLEVGTYEVHYTSSGSLKAVVTGVVVTSSANTAMDAVSLINGDVNVDNEVTDVDVDAVKSNLDLVGD